MMRQGVIVLAVLGLYQTQPAHADRAEAQWSARTLTGVVQMRADRAPDPTYGLVGGLALAVSYGISNQLDLGVELLSFVTSEPDFENASLTISDDTAYSTYTRREGATLFLAGATWRYGVDWVPVLAVSGGAGVRYRDNGAFSPMRFYPVEDRAERVLDVAILGKAGIERRINRSVTLGAYSALLTDWSPDAPLMASLSLSLGVSYVHYPAGLNRLRARW